MSPTDNDLIIRRLTVLGLKRLEKRYSATVDRASKEAAIKKQEMELRMEIG